MLDLRPRIDAGAEQVPPLVGVAELELEQPETDLTNAFVLDRKQELDAAVEVAVHPVGAGEIEFGVAAVLEIEEPGVFEIAVHNAGDPHVLLPWFRLVTADAAHDEVDFDPGVGRLMQQPDHLLVGKAVHLGDDPPRTVRR